MLQFVPKVVDAQHHFSFCWGWIIDIWLSIPIKTILMFRYTKLYNCHLVLDSVSWYLVILIHIHWRISVTFSPQYLFYNPSAKIMNRGDTYMYDTFILLSIRIIQLNEHLNLLKNCAGWCISRENAIHIHRLGRVWSAI